MGWCSGQDREGIGILECRNMDGESEDSVASRISEVVVHNVLFPIKSFECRVECPGYCSHLDIRVVRPHLEEVSSETRLASEEFLSKFNLSTL